MAAHFVACVDPCTTPLLPPLGATRYDTQLSLNYNATDDGAPVASCAWGVGLCDAPKDYVALPPETDTALDWVVSAGDLTLSPATSYCAVVQCVNEAGVVGEVVTAGIIVDPIPPVVVQLHDGVHAILDQEYTVANYLNATVKCIDIGSGPGVMRVRVVERDVAIDETAYGAEFEIPGTATRIDIGPEHTPVGEVQAFLLYQIEVVCVDVAGNPSEVKMTNGVVVEATAPYALPGDVSQGTSEYIHAAYSTSRNTVTASW